MNLNSLKIAALLHDIGKFYQRTREKHNSKYDELTKKDYGSNGAHSKWSASYITKMDIDPEIEELTLYHHNPEKSSHPQMAKILQKADHHSSKERDRSDEIKEVNKEPLISVFSQVKLLKDNETYYFSLKTLDPNSQSLNPSKFKKEAMEGHNLQHQYEDLWKSFLSESETLNGEADFNTLYYLLKKYTSFIPSAVYLDKPDISLFDHSKTTAALATCLYHYYQEKEEIASDEDQSYLILSGDLSGIQDFIYKISSPQEAQKGMSKRLRGRSFYLTLLNDAIAHSIIRDLELCEANILFCGGGHFTIIAPNTKKVNEKLELVIKEVNETLYHDFRTDIYLAMTKLPCSGNDLEEFGKLMEEASYQNQRHKRQKFQNMLGEIFKEEKTIPHDICPVCGNVNEANNSFCRSCTDHEDLGRKIANAEYIIRSVSEDRSGDVNLLGVSYWLAKTDKDVNKALDKISSNIEVLKLNNTDFISIKKADSRISAGFTFMGNTVPYHSQKGTLFFSHLAEISKGANKLGILKMDVDNLGRIFAKGLKQPTISRVSTLSSFMDFFFSGYINRLARDYRVLEKVCPNCHDKIVAKQLEFDEEESPVTVYQEKGKDKVCEECSKNSIPTIYTVYSGGDDLLVLGPYDDVISFAKDLREDFKNWICNNRDINLSAGIFLGGGKFPVARAINNADKYLELSKNEKGKDCISLFNETLKWDTQDLYKGFVDLFEFGLKLEELNQQRKISKGLVYSMLVLWENTFGDMSTNSRDKSRIERRNYVPLYKYKLRTVMDRKVREELNQEGLKFMPWIRVPASWVSLRTR